MMKETEYSKNDDSSAFIDAEKREQIAARRTNRSKSKKTTHIAANYSWQQKLLGGLGGAFVISLILMYLVAGNQTTPVFRMLKFGISRYEPFDIPWETLLLLSLPLICIFQLLTYFGQWSSEICEKWKKAIFDKLAFAFHLIAAICLVTGLAGIYLMFMVAFWLKILDAMNFRLDDSQPIQIRTQLIERIPSRSFKIAATLKLVDWNTQSSVKPVSVGDSSKVFEIKGDVVTFYMRKGAFGWAYAIDKQYAQALVSKQRQ
jgi:hypothetical protein